MGRLFRPSVCSFGEGRRWRGYIRPSLRSKVSAIHINGSLITPNMRKPFFLVSIIKLFHSFAGLYPPVTFKLTVTLLSVRVHFETRRYVHFQYRQVVS